MVVFDATVLLLVLDRNARPPGEIDTGRPVERAAERIEFLVRKLALAKEQILIPTPVLSEVLIYAGSATPEYLRILNEQACFRIVPFDQKAAIEAALAMRDSLDRGGIRIDASAPYPTKTKVKFDRQIIAIAKAEGADTIYSDDQHIMKYGKTAGINVVKTEDLHLPPEDPQRSLNLGAAGSGVTDD